MILISQGTRHKESWTFSAALPSFVLTMHSHDSRPKATAKNVLNHKTSFFSAAQPFTPSLRGTSRQSLSCSALELSLSIVVGGSEIHFSTSSQCTCQIFYFFAIFLYEGARMSYMLTDDATNFSMNAVWMARPSLWDTYGGSRGVYLWCT